MQWDNSTGNYTNQFVSKCSSIYNLLLPPALQALHPHPPTPPIPSPSFRDPLRLQLPASVAPSAAASPPSISPAAIGPSPFAPALQLVLTLPPRPPPLHRSWNFLRRSVRRCGCSGHRVGGACEEEPEEWTAATDRQPHLAHRRVIAWDAVMAAAMFLHYSACLTCCRSPERTPCTL
jgi:hypothetical protein